MIQAQQNKLIAVAVATSLGADMKTAKEIAEDVSRTFGMRRIHDTIWEEVLEYIETAVWDAKQEA